MDKKYRAQAHIRHQLERYEYTEVTSSVVEEAFPEPSEYEKALELFAFQQSGNRLPPQSREEQIVQFCKTNNLSVQTCGIPGNLIFSNNEWPVQHTSNYDIINIDLALRNPIVYRVLQLLEHPDYPEINSYSEALEVMVIELAKANKTLMEELKRRPAANPFQGLSK